MSAAATSIYTSKSDAAAGRDSHAARNEMARLLWEKHYAPLAGWCATLVGNHDEAHDIAAEAFTRLLSRWTQVRDPRGYLYVTATNLAHDKWRREKRDRMRSQQLRTVTPTCTTASEPWLRDLVDRLPDRMHMPVLLHYYADMPIEQVAAALHRPQGTIKRTLGEARRQLKMWLDESDQEVPAQSGASPAI